MPFAGKAVLVIGGSSGIGRGIARAFRDGGAATTACGTRASVADYDSAEELDGIAYTRVDVTDADAVRAAASVDRQEFDIAAFRAVVEVNLNSMMTCAQAFVPRLSAADDAIVTVSSTAACHAMRGKPAYNARKCGAVGVTRTRGQAWAAKGVRVNGIAPGLSRDQADDRASRPARRRARHDPAGADGRARGDGGGGAVPRLAAGELRRRPDADRRRRHDAVNDAATDWREAIGLFDRALHRIR